MPCYLASCVWLCGDETPGRASCGSGCCCEVLGVAARGGFGSSVAVGVFSRLKVLVWKFNSAEIFGVRIHNINTQKNYQ